MNNSHLLIISSTTCLLLDYRPSQQKRVCNLHNNNLYVVFGWKKKIAIFKALPCNTIDVLAISRSVKQVNEHIASNMITNVMSTYSVRVGIAAEMQIDIMQETSEWAS